MDQPQPGATPIHWVPAAPPPQAWELQRPIEAAPRYAGFWRRLVALWLDNVLVTIVILVASSIRNGILEDDVVANAIIDSLWLGLAFWLAAYIVPVIAIDWLYFAGQESSRYQATLGKRALGIKVTDLAGGRISFARATGRYFAKYLSLLSLGIGYLVQPFTAKRQALHDAVAGTVVARSRV